MKNRIIVEPPTSDARRERVERKLFEQLAAVRMVERVEAVIPPAKKNRTPLWFGAGALAAAAVLAVVLFSGNGSTTPEVPAPTRVVTPVGGTSQFTVPGALIEARSDTSVEVQHGSNGAITLVVARGAIECNVEHRVNKAPFRVIAGDVTVEVIGTIFTVARTPIPRVDVARGKVRVSSGGNDWLVEAGEAWTPSVTAAVIPKPEPKDEPASEEAPSPTPEAEPLPSEPQPAPKTQSPAKPKVEEPKPQEPKAEEPKAAEPTKAERDLARETYRIANKLEQSDPQKAAQLYRSIATNGKGMEAVALVSLAEVELRLKHPAEALAALDELKKRFPNKPFTEDAAWFRYEALRTMGKRDEARTAAADYLRQFPSGAYADRLRGE